MHVHIIQAHNLAEKAAKLHYRLPPTMVVELLCARLRRRVRRRQNEAAQTAPESSSPEKNMDPLSI